jgi:hypothetical protein
MWHQLFYDYSVVWVCTEYDYKQNMLYRVFANFVKVHKFAILPFCLPYAKSNILQVCYRYSWFPVNLQVNDGSTEAETFTKSKTILAHHKTKHIVKFHNWFRSYNNIKGWTTDECILPSRGVGTGKVFYQQAYPVKLGKTYTKVSLLKGYYNNHMVGSEPYKN